MTVKLITQGQIRRIVNLGADAIAKVIEEGLVELDNDSAQKVIYRGGEFASVIRDSALSALQNLSVSDRFRDEEVESNYGYLSGYKPEGEDLDRQIAVLQGLFPGLGGANSSYLKKVKSGAVKVPKYGEKFFAVVNIWKSSPPVGFSEVDTENLIKVLDTIKQTRNGKFINYREGQLDEKHVRQSAQTRKSFQELSEAQGYPSILIVPAQFGIRHRGRSVRRACEVFFNEFGFDPFTVGNMILTHPERLQHYDDLWIDCPGGEFSSNADGDFSMAFYFTFNDGHVEFSAAWINCASSDYGSVSGFLSQ